MILLQIFNNLRFGMSSIVCSLSGSALNQGVVSIKTGHVYQKSTILRHIRAYGTCPHTNQKLSESDLLAINKQIKNPQMVGAQYSDLQKVIPKMQSQFQILLLQAHYLKNQLKQSRQQLALSLYKQDACIRIIGKLQDQLQNNRAEIVKLVEKRKMQQQL